MTSAPDRFARGDRAQLLDVVVLDVDRQEARGAVELPVSPPGQGGPNHPSGEAFAAVHGAETTSPGLGPQWRPATSQDACQVPNNWTATTESRALPASTTAREARQREEIATKGDPCIEGLDADVRRTSNPASQGLMRYAEAAPVHADQASSRPALSTLSSSPSTGSALSLSPAVTGLSGASNSALERRIRAPRRGTCVRSPRPRRFRGSGPRPLSRSPRPRARSSQPRCWPRDPP